MHRFITLGLIAATVLLATTLTRAGDGETYLFGVELLSEAPGTVQASVVLDSSAGSDVSAWSYGVCHDPLHLTLGEVVDGSTTATVADGSPPEFNQLFLFPNGYVLGVVISFAGAFILPPGSGYQLSVADYDPVNGTSAVTDICPCDTLGTPPFEAVVISSGEAFVPEIACLTVETVTPSPFLRGDCNDDGLLDLADGIWNVDELFQSGPTATCNAACDANGDGMRDATDSIYLWNYTILDGPPPPFPFPGCGAIAGVDCESSSTCGG